MTTAFDGIRARLRAGTADAEDQMIALAAWMATETALNDLIDETRAVSDELCGYIETLRTHLVVARETLKPEA